MIPKPKKGQKCFGCKKLIKDDYAWNGHFWHEKCIEKKAIERYLKKIKK
jgi:hypothetical protein